MWKIKTPGGNRSVLARDETLRDGNQSEVPRSAWRAINHIITQSRIYDVMTLGWIYTSPTDTAIADYLRDHGEELAKKVEGYDKNKFLIYSLVYRGSAKTPEEVDPKDPFGFGKILGEIKSKKQPYGIINILTKARCKDLEDLGLDSESLQKDLANTAQLIKQANPDITVEIALEHFYTAWLEKDNQAANRKHIIDTIVTGLLAGSVRITAPDTDGAHTPDEITEVIQEVTAALRSDERLTGAHPPIHFDPSMFIAHMHDDLGHAAENTEAALQAGAGSFDSTAGIMGERRGNVTTSAMANRLRHPEAKKIAKYQADLAEQLGIKPGDKPVGSPEAQCAVGGMHGHALLLALRKAQQDAKDNNPNITPQELAAVYDDFVKHYSGSYASAHPDGVPLQATLSPVAGAANVLFMLSRFGLDSDDKKDPRIAEVLTEVKEGEFNRGVNYRGYNNANAFLLLADKFGLREHLVAGSEDKARNKLHLTITTFDGDFVDEYEHWLHVGFSTPKDSIEWPGAELPHDSRGFTHVSSIQNHPLAKIARKLGQKYTGLTVISPEHGGFVYDVAETMLRGATDRLKRVDERFGDLHLLEAREFEVPVGPVHAGERGVTDPQPHKSLMGEKLIFTTGTDEWFQANGVGKTHEEALAKATETALDFQLFQIERERAKEGLSPILEVEGAKQYLADQWDIIKGRKGGPGTDGSSPSR